MCGIAGILKLADREPVAEAELRRMLALLRHRGPDEFGIFLGNGIGLGSARLRIIDLSTGQQPIGNEDGTLWIVFNGEIFNYVELRPDLEARGHRFTTDSDTEVLLHLYEEFGPECLAKVNGQFAFAIWDTRAQSLFLARDRMGIRPLFYTIADGALVFGSEIKALLASGRVRAELDSISLDQVFSYWSTLSPRTAFRDVLELPPAHWLTVRNGHIRTQRYWTLPFGAEEHGRRSTDEYVEELRTLLIDAARIRLRADVPVGAYLSGGLDSAIIAAAIRKFATNHLDTFSISFSDPAFDESAWQRQMADFLGTHHQVVYATHADIGRVFPQVVWHAETPILRTAPVPMFLLSELLHQRGFRVALTGEGADEVFAGYDIFKEALVRRFWARQPESTWRPRLLQRLYPDIGGLTQAGPAFLAAFFREGLAEVDSPFYSHAVRWRTSQRTRRFFSDELLATVGQKPRDPAAEIPLPPEFMHWSLLERAQWIEMTVFLANYLLCSQGDRMGMAHAVEGRFPFLDYRVVEFAGRLLPRLKLRGLTEKWLLREAAAPWLPPEIAQRPKRPYRAPIHRSFFSNPAPDYVRELLSPASLKATGLFRPATVSQLVGKLERGQPVGETDDMALAGILSAQLVHRQFIEDFRAPPPLSDRDNVKLCRAGEPARVCLP